MEWRLNGAQPKEPKAPRQAKAAIQQIHQLWAELRAQQLIGIALLARRAGDEFVSWGVKGGCKPQATSPKSKRAPPNFILLRLNSYSFLVGYGAEPICAAGNPFRSSLTALLHSFLLCFH